MVKAGKQSICMTYLIYAEQYVKQNENLMKIAKPVISGSNLVYTTSNSFLYAKRFHKIFLRIHASGIQKLFRHTRKIHNPNLEEKENIRPDSTNNINQLIIILSGGYIISIIVFFAELVIKPNRVTRICCFSRYDKHARKVRFTRTKALPKRYKIVLCIRLN